MKKDDLQLTPQRQAVLEAVQHARTHVDAYQVFDVVRRQIPRISLGTVYRALGTLSEAGLLHEIETGNGPALFDSNLNPHQHIICRRCGSVADLRLDLGGDVLDEAASKSGFASVEYSRVDFHGVCRKCHTKPHE